jgi:Zn-dependent alcohol dehydrogenase
MAENYQARTHREELKKEYLRGVEETRAMQQESVGKFLELVKDKLSKSMDKSVTLEGATDDMESIIQLIDEYTVGGVPVDRLIDREIAVDTIDELEDKIGDIELNNGEEVISLMDFVDKDN